MLRARGSANRQSSGSGEGEWAPPASPRVVQDALAGEGRALLIEFANPVAELADAAAKIYEDE